MSKPRLLLGWLCLWLLLPALASAAQVAATLDRNSVALGETVTLNVHVRDAGGAVDTPDFSPLAGDFEILGSSQNRSLSIVNGTRQSELTFGIALRPRRVGVLQVPSLQVAGESTRPLPLEVTAQPPTNATGGPQQDVFVEVQAEPARAYVGQQVSYVVRLFYAVNLGGTLDTPQIDGARLVKAGDDLKYITQRGGRSMQVLERRFALIPQRAGTLHVPAPTFEGEQTDPYDLRGFFGSGEPVSARGQPVTVQVQAAPATADIGAWLPAREVILTLDAPDPQQPWQVGQPVNLTLKLRAIGLAADALPLPTLPTIGGATVYPDKSVDTTGNAGSWLVGERQRTFAVVPGRAGTLTIPPMRLAWWNVLSDRAEVIDIPARQFTVQGAPPAPGALTQPANGGSVSRAAPAADAAAASGTARAPPWRWIALASVGLWLISLLWWWRSRRRKRRVQPAAVPAGDSVRTKKAAFMAAAGGIDAAAQAQCLLAWAQAERPAIVHLGQLSGALDDATQQAAIASLQRRCYAADSVAETPALAEAFRSGFVWRAEADVGDDTGLPPLYPFNLR